MRSAATLYSLLILAFALATAGCETTDRILTTTERLAEGRTGQIQTFKQFEKRGKIRDLEECDGKSLGQVIAAAFVLCK